MFGRTKKNAVNDTQAANVIVVAEPKVSIVIPIFNQEKYLEQCLDSVINQTLKEIEIICVNDGSTDRSLEILEEYAARDPRITIIDKPNAGYGQTMNTGFAAAHGEYIGIGESDDFADPRMFEDLYTTAKKLDLDLVKANYYEYADGVSTLMKPWNGFAYKQVFDPREDQVALTVLPIIWSALYRRSMIVDNDIRFNETPGASYQDTSFVHQVWMCARRVALLKKGYIHYRVDNAASSVNSSSKVFAVCDEYAMSEAFMWQDIERAMAFAGIMNLLKLGTYRWNFNRIAPEFRKDFAQRMAEEYKDARTKGTLDEGYFDPYSWEQLNLLMDDFDEFLARYQEAGM